MNTDTIATTVQIVNAIVALKDKPKQDYRDQRALLAMESALEELAKLHQKNDILAAENEAFRKIIAII